jgi:hypothetical protein
LLALSFAAHFMPALWAVGVAIYRWLYRRLQPRWTPAWFGVSVIAIAMLRLILNERYAINASTTRVIALTGADQFWIFGYRTLVFVPLMVGFWGFLFLQVLKARSPLRILLGFPAQVLILNMVAILLLPGGVIPGGYQQGFLFITERVSLFVAISVCALLTSARPRALETALMSAVYCAFFLTIFGEGRTLDRLEDNVDRIVETLPPNSRVVAPLGAIARTNQWGHIIDGACIGRCFSYANYEPSINQFRIRVNGSSPLVTSDFITSSALQAGIYNPPAGSPGYYQIDEDCGKGSDLCVKHVNVPGDPAAPPEGRNH